MLTPDFTHLIFGPLRSIISLFTFWMETMRSTGWLIFLEKFHVITDFGSLGAKHCHVSSTEVTVTKKINCFLLVDKRAMVVCDVSFWYKGNY